MSALVPGGGGCKGAVGAQGIVEGGVSAAAIEEAVEVVSGIPIIADDLARIVDAKSTGVGARGIVEGCVGSVDIEEAVSLVAAIEIIPDDLAHPIDAGCSGGDGGGQGIVKGGVGAPGVKEAMGATVVVVVPDDLARGVDAGCAGDADGQRIVDGGVGVDRHDTGSVVIVSRQIRDRRLSMLRCRQNRLL